MDFEHYLITRFSIKIWNVDKNNNTLRTPDWYKHRFKLFDEYCYPSVVSQSNKNFKWLVFFDAADEAKYGELINKYREFENFIPIFLMPKSGIVYSCIQEINKRVLPTTKYLITSRIDSDDAFHKDAINTIQQQFDYQLLEFINLTNGLILLKDAIYFSKEVSNGYISLIEKRGDGGFKTVWVDWHNRLSKYGVIKQVSNGIHWLTNRHERNQSVNWCWDNADRTAKKAPREILECFSVKI